MERKMLKRIGIIILIFIILAIAIKNYTTFNRNLNEETSMNINEVVDKNEESIKTTNKVLEKQVNGIIEKIDNNKLFVYCDGIIEEVDYTEELINMRTREKILLKEINVYDYYESSGEIARNISGNELKQELLKNMAKCFPSGPLYANPIQITNLEDKGEYVIIDVTMEDVLSGKLGRQFDARVDMKLKVNNKTNISTVQKIDIKDLKEETNGFMFWIEIVEDTIDDEYPTVKTIEIYDK